MTLNCVCASSVVCEFEANMPREINFLYVLKAWLIKIWLNEMPKCAACARIDVMAVFIS